MVPQLLAAFIYFHEFLRDSCPLLNTIDFFQRYYYYIEKGIDQRQVAGPPPEQLNRIKYSLPEHLRNSPLLAQDIAELHNEVLKDYDFSYRKSISMCF